MADSSQIQSRLRQLPGVDHLLEQASSDPFFADVPKAVLLESIRATLEDLRSILRGSNEKAAAQTDLASPAILRKAKARITRALTPNLVRVVNATGVIVHTNLGRSLLACEALQNLATIAGRYSNLEFDLEKGHRGSRYTAVEDILCEITGAEAAMVVNNNAAAVLLCLETLARGREVIVSRGELVEIGGSFRIPEVMVKSGAILREVGTSNRTHLRDYEAGIDNASALLLKVHKSNYSIVGFAAEVGLKELVALGRRYHLPVMEDLGSGTFIDFARYGLLKEPTVQESVATGADVVTFSGDKLLGGPQAGVIVGRAPIIEQVKQNPLNRALRIDKMTLAALESTLRLYRDEKEALESVPTLRMMTRSYASVAARAEALAEALGKLDEHRLDVCCLDRTSKTGGGSLPLLELPTRCVAVRMRGLSVNAAESMLRAQSPPIIGRIEDDRLLLDPRTVAEDETPLILDAFTHLLQAVEHENR